MSLDVKHNMKGNTGKACALVDQTQNITFSFVWKRHFHRADILMLSSLCEFAFKIKAVFHNITKGGK